jgi:hypothetical protein
MKNIKTITLAIAFAFLLPVTSFAYYQYRSRSHNYRYNYKPAVVKPVALPAPAPTPPILNAALGTEVRFKAYLTSYTYWDNTPPGSADISHPVIHSKAGGTGTYKDPITLAVGHSMATGKDVLDYPAGTKFYIPNLRKYFIVEDTCGDGNSPQNGPCHTGHNGTPWLDMWIDGASGTSSTSNTCAEVLTETHLVIKNPSSLYPVSPGAVFSASCAKQWGDAM